jgi:hypothetical protein
MKFYLSIRENQYQWKNSKNESQNLNIAKMKKKYEIVVFDCFGSLDS